MNTTSPASTPAAPAADPVLRARLDAFVGQGADRPGFLARGPIERAQIRAMTDAVGDRNPIYTDEAFARGTVHGGLVAPPLWLNGWVMQGLRPEDEELVQEDGTAFFHLAPAGQRPVPRAARTIRDELNEVLAEYGYTTPAAVNIGHSYLRYLRPGEQPRFTSWIIESISDPKNTKLGEAIFVTQRMDVYVGDEQVASIRQRYLRARPVQRTDKTPPVAAEKTGDPAGESTVATVATVAAATKTAAPAAPLLSTLRRVPPRPRTQSLRYSAVQVADVLPPLGVRISATLIVAGAVASQDYQDVHHDYPGMGERGHPHIFMNIHTTSGLLGRFVTDWAGPEAIIREYEMQLMRPNYPGDTMRLTGRVRSCEQRDGRGLVTVDLTGTNSLGTHTQASMVVELPAG